MGEAILHFFSERGVVTKKVPSLDEKIQEVESAGLGFDLLVTIDQFRKLAT